MKNLLAALFLTLVCCVSLFADGKPQTFTLQELMQSVKSTATISMPTQDIAKEVLDVDKSTGPMDAASISKKVKLAINQLGSTVSSNDQSMAKNRLIKIGKPAVAPLSDALINDKRTWTRCQIARVLGKIGDQSAIPALEATTSTKFEVLNKASIEALGSIGGLKSVASLEKIKAANNNNSLSQAIEDAITKAKEK